jgi:short subunit dehydrogenase-like uncharacterized protein
MAQGREFDIVIHGASGFTGRLVAEYLAAHYGSSGPRWAMSGRNAAKLAQVRDAIGAPADTPILLADAADPESLASLAARSRVVLTTVGPYQLYGEALVAACAEAGTDYADLCGEPLWMRAMIDRHEAAAKASGARICFSCGFDSIPFELAVVLLQRECMARFGAPAPRVKGRVRAMKGGFSGGTAASLKETMVQIGRDPALIALLASPFALTPGFAGPEQPKDSVRFDEATGSWATPFIMAPINTKNVHRANALLGHAWGTDFTYDELLLTGPGEAGEQAARFVASTKMLGTENDPKPGEGPSKEERESGFYDVLMIAEMPDGQTLRLGVKGRYDPGYGSTSRMLAETGMALLSHQGPGGIWTPGALLGDALAQRLADHAEITFAVEE